MSAQLESQTTEAAPQARAESRWGVRLTQLAAIASESSTEVMSGNDTTSRLEPIDMRVRPSLWDRLRRGAAVPIAAAATIFIIVVLASVATVWLQPHTVNAAADSGVATASAAEEEMTSLPDAAQGPAPPSNTPSSNNEMVYVHVVGEVQRPGVYEINAGSRVLAAIEAAGGATELAVLSALNLARPLTDGEQIVVPDSAGAAESQQASSSIGAPPAAGIADTSAPPINLNTADQGTLETLPRVGPALAERILAWREEHGGFESVEQLLSVSGIGQKTFEQLQTLVTV